MEDAELIRLIGEGRDEDAFRLLYTRHTGPVYGLLCRLTAHSADASDLMQETWLRAVRHLGLFRGQSAFRTWLTGIALNCYREWRRKHSRDLSSAAADKHRSAATDKHRSTQIQGSGVHAGPGTAADDVAAIGLALAGLSPEHREVIVLHDIEGYTHDEIAEVLEIEAGTSKSRLSRARRTFRERWRGQA